MQGNSEWLLHQATASAWKTRVTPKHRRGGAGVLFRVLDKPGQYVGLVHPFEAPPRSPFRVTAIKQCQLLRITQSKVWSVLSNFEARVQARFCRISPTTTTPSLPHSAPSHGGADADGMDRVVDDDDFERSSQVDNLGLTPEQRAQLLLLDDDEEDPEDGYGDAPSCNDRVKREFFGDITFAARKSRVDRDPDTRRKSGLIAVLRLRCSVVNGRRRDAHLGALPERYSSIASVPDCCNRASQRGSTMSVPGNVPRNVCALCNCMRSGCGRDAAARVDAKLEPHKVSRALRASQHRGSDAERRVFPEPKVTAKITRPSWWHISGGGVAGPQRDARVFGALTGPA